MAMSLRDRHAQLLTPAVGAALLVAVIVGHHPLASESELFVSQSVAASSPGVPVGLPDRARLIFSDNFVESSLDTAKWTTCYPWAPPSGCTNPNTKELEWYDAEGVSLTGGALQLTARRQSVWEDGHQYAFTSGMVASAGAFQFTYGYVQFRARLPTGAGLWPALWLLPANESWPPEIDVLEVDGADADVAALTYHPFHGQQEQRLVRIPDLSIGWHTFAIDWQPTSIVWYIDGRAEFEVTGQVPSQPMYLLMDLAVSGLEPPNATTRFPASFAVNDVRVWQPG